MAKWTLGIKRQQGDRVAQLGKATGQPHHGALGAATMEGAHETGDGAAHAGAFGGGSRA